MKFLFLIFVLVPALISAEEEKVEEDKVEVEKDDLKLSAIKEENNVLVLTDDNFDDFVNNNEFVLVEFYAPWCGHCKKLEPDYAEAAKIVRDRDFACSLAKVDATAEKELAKKFGIKGYPTLKFFKAGKPTDYKGPRDPHGIVLWLEKHTGPVAIDVDKSATVEDLKKKHDVVILACVKDDEDKKKFSDIAEDYADDDMRFLMTNSEEVLKSENCKAGTVLMIKNFDDPRLEYDGELKKKDLKKWIDEKSKPLIFEFTQSSAPKIFASKIKVHFLYFINEDDKEIAKNAITPLKKVAEQFGDKLVFVYINAADKSNKNVLDFFGLKEENLPTYGIYKIDGNAKYMAKHNSEADRNQVVKFIEKFLDGTLEKTLKSEEVPEDWDKEPVKVLVGKNFEKVAKDKSKHVFVEFYAPWCGHCKNLAPIWDDLGKKFEDNENVVIAKMDATANEVSDVNIGSFPTLKLFKKDTNEMLSYDGGRTLDDFVEYIEDLLEEKAEDEKKEEEEDDKKSDKKDEL